MIRRERTRRRGCVGVLTRGGCRFFLHSGRKCLTTGNRPSKSRLRVFRSLASEPVVAVLLGMPAGVSEPAVTTCFGSRTLERAFDLQRSNLPDRNEWIATAVLPSGNLSSHLSRRLRVQVWPSGGLPCCPDAAFSYPNRVRFVFDPVPVAGSVRHRQWFVTDGVRTDPRKHTGA